MYTPQHSQSSLSTWMGFVHTNNAGNVHGGEILKLVDQAAALAAIRHSGCRVVTAALDQMTFDLPVHVGDLVVIEARVNQAWNSSMEVGVRVWAELPEEDVRRRVATAYLTFVALDTEGKACKVPQIEWETQEDRRRAQDADRRRGQRLEAKKR